MDVSLSTALAQEKLFDQVGTAVARKGLDAQQQEGQNLLKLMASAAPAFTDPLRGQHLDLTV